MNYPTSMVNVSKFTVDSLITFLRSFPDTELEDLAKLSNSDLRQKLEEISSSPGGLYNISWMTNTDDLQTKLLFLRGTPFVFLCVDYIRPGYVTAQVLKNELYPSLALVLEVLQEMGYKKLWSFCNESKGSIKLHELLGFTILDKRIAFMQVCFWTD